ncbi:MAG: c-type cytochrome [Steroidobacteraceae bacterium]
MRNWALVSGRAQGTTCRAASRCLLVAGLCVALGTAFMGGPARAGEAAPTNHPPVVKILLPKADSVFEGNSLVRYEISVSDEEDGDSKFQEIPANEVFLEVRYLPQASQAIALLNQAPNSDPRGLEGIKHSNCLKCHAFNAKLIGPSFVDIGKRYPYSASNVGILSQHIHDGASGVWGNVKMPSHPELTQTQTEDMVSWILQHAADPDTSYMAGTEGTFRIKDAADSPGKGKGIIALIASYTDHGLKDAPEKSLRGQDIILIRNR